jgi:hypothetical protein
VDLRAWVESLPDIAVIGVCGELVQLLNDHVTDDLDTLVAAAPVELSREPAFAAALARAQADYQMRLPPAESVAVARTLLSAVADSATLAPALAAVAKDYRDKRQFALEVLAFGVAVSMVIFVATTRVERSPDGKWHVVKDVASPALVKAAVRAVQPLGAQGGPG